MDIQSLLEAVRQSPEMMESVAQISQELESEGVSPDMLNAMGEAVGQVIDAPETYPDVRAQAIEQGMVDEDDLPPEFNLAYMLAMLVAINEVMGHLSQAPRFAKGGLAQLARQGRGGDTMLAHINSAEAEVLRRMGGSGTVNPSTGIVEFKGGGLKTALTAMSKGVRKVAKKLIRPVLTIASMVPGPWQVPALALNAVYNASQGNWLGAGLSAFGAYAAPGGFGGFGEAGSSAAGMGGSLGNGISGGLNTTFGALGDGASALAGAGTSGAAGMGSSLGSGISGSLAGAGSAVGSAAGAAAEGLGGLSFSGLGEGLGGLSFSGLGEASLPAMETLGGLGDGVSGSLPSLGETAAPSAWDMYKTAKSIYGPAKTAYNMLNPPEPQQFSQQNAQRQMQQMGGMPGINTNRAFGYGGNQSRGAGQATRWGNYRNGGLARCTCKE